MKETTKGKNMSLILFGSGEFTNLVNDIDLFLIKNYQFKSIAVLPTAAGLESDWLKWIDQAQVHYKKFKIKVIPLLVQNQQQANDQKIINLLDQAEAIFISGGNPIYLHDQLQNTILLQKILDKINQTNFMVAGSSAGAMIMGSYILKRPFRANLSHNTTNWLEGFKIISPTVFPHFDRFNQLPFFFNNIINKSPDKVKNNWLGIDENTALIVNQKYQKIGSGHVTISLNQTTEII